MKRALSPHHFPGAFFSLGSGHSLPLNFVAKRSRLPITCAWEHDCEPFVWLQASGWKFFFKFRLCSQMSSQGRPKRPYGGRPLRPRQSSHASSDGRPVPDHPGHASYYTSSAEESMIRGGSSNAYVPYRDVSAGAGELISSLIEEEPGFFPSADSVHPLVASPTQLSEATTREVMMPPETDPLFPSTVFESPKPLTSKSLTSSSSPPPSRPSSRASGARQVAASPPAKDPRALWGQLRNAVLPSFPTPARQLTNEYSPPPFRPSTPSSIASSQKPSRFPKLRNTVEQLRKTDIESEIELACSTIRSAVASDPGVWGLQRSADADHSHSSSSGGNSGLARIGRGLRRVPSTGSVATATTKKRTQFSGFFQLQSTLSHFSSLPAFSYTLPRQTEVLAVLLLPFHWRSKGNRRVSSEEACSRAVDVFQMILTNWKSDAIEGEVERILWCLKALAFNHSEQPVSSISMHLMASVTTLLHNPPALRPHVPPIIQQTILQHLILFQRTVMSSQQPLELSNIARQVTDLIHHVQGGGFALTDEESLVSEYNLVLDHRLSAEERDLANSYMFSEAVTRLLRVANMNTQAWILNQLLDSYWHAPGTLGRSVIAPIALRRLSAFTEFAVDRLGDDKLAEQNPDSHETARLILGVLRSRIIPESSALFESNPLCMSHAVCVVLGLLKHRSTRDDAHSIIDEWRVSEMGATWRDALEHELKSMAARDEPKRLYSNIKSVFEGTSGHCRRYLLSVVLPYLFDRLVAAPISPSTPFTTLLNSIAQAYPQIFYKPLFDCARTNKDLTVVAQIRILVALSDHIPDLFVRNAEMMTVALLSNVGATVGKGKARAGNTQWGKARIGQCVLMTELLTKLHTLTPKVPNLEASVFDVPPSDDFFVQLENKIAVLLNAKEQTSMIPFSQRILLCQLFLKIRSYSPSTRRALWLPTVVNWAAQCDIGTMSTPVPHPGDDSFEHSEEGLLVDEDVIEEADFTLSKVGMIYTSSFAPSRVSQTTSALVLHALDFAAMDKVNASNLQEREFVRNNFPRSVKAASLPLLVAMYSQLREHDFRRILPSIWLSGLENPDSRLVASACFLFMLCAEKLPTQANRLMEDDLHSDVIDVRHRALQKLSILYSWRHQILAQVPGHTDHRLFRVAAKPLPFVATDMGSQKWASNQAPEDALVLLGASLPGEIRRRLLELDWIRTAKEKEEERLIKWHQLPLSILPKVTFDVAEHQQNNAPATPQSPMPTGPGASGLLRRKSSIGYSAVRRRAVLVPSIVQTISKLTSLSEDHDLFVSVTAQQLLFSALIDDPSTICRPSIEALNDPFSTSSDTASALSAYLHIQTHLPPLLSHHILNHLAGHVKNLLRNSDSPNKLPRVASVMPLVSRLASTVSDLTFRDMKRNKAEALLLPTFSLWLSDITHISSLRSQSQSSQPRNGQDDEEFIPDVVTFRIAQNMFLYRHILRHQKDIQLIRRQFSVLQLPSARYTLPLRPVDFVPTAREDPSSTTGTVPHLSLTLSRSYLLVTLEILRSISRSSTDMSEVSKFIDGINLVMVVHGDDLGIVSHSLMAYMTASTRFWRLFATHSGFGMIMPAILKVYCERWHHTGIRAAIEYTIQRFYALHEKAFIFQTLDAFSRMLMSPTLTSSKEAFANQVFPLFVSLHTVQQGRTFDAAGIHGSNVGQEREAVLTLLNESPEVLLLPSKSQGVDPTNEVVLSTFSNLVEKWKGRRFPFEDLIRLILTIIAHAPTAKRAEGFLRILRCWAVNLYADSTSTRTLLQQGIEALGGTLFGKVGRRPRAQDAPNTSDSPYRDEAQQDEQSISTSPADPNVLRQEYIVLVIRFSSAGGMLSTHTLRATFELVQYVVRDQGVRAGTLATDFVQQMTKRMLAKDARLPPKQVIPFLTEIGILFRELDSVVDLSSVIDAVTSLIKDGSFSSDREFVQTVVSQFCRQALEACVLAAGERRLLDYAPRQSIVSLLVAAATLPDSIVISMIEQQPPTPAFLACIMLPFCFRVQFQGVTPGRGWIRLLAYVMDGYNRMPSMNVEMNRSNTLGGSIEKAEKGQNPGSNVNPRERSARAMVVLQIIKVIVVRMSVDSQYIVHGLWSRIASFIRRLLMEGSISFVLFLSRAKTPHASRSTSPFSPDIVESKRVSFSSSDIHGESNVSHTLQQIRASDCILSSMLEFITLYRSPLTLQLRPWAQGLFAELESSKQSLGFPSPSPSSPGSRRVSSVFSKVRPRSTQSPDISPQPTSHDLPSILAMYSEDDLRQAGYTLPRSRSASPSHVGASRNIVHLGPVTARRVNSEGSSEDHAAFVDRIVSADLLQSAVKKIHVAQAWFGFGNEDVIVHAWTRGVALERIAEETKGFMREYQDVFSRSVRDSYVEVLPV
ncbi:uncharacterized protein EI90DRAFT_1709729 [Cantharellus anzutake]|uniref:uncharacterized protein n=1 Tax=Cantharellus anzutake TaxID=1750568 RepID=UPI001902D267|nr:uncharacterized protein EI90DRAFT_1709729 [Cantharellus anzutake]KAF8341261.1 hypothetical protein EI90DRAFT_1709729 [Cantharellus anzutake]